MADETAGDSDQGERPKGLSSPRVRLGLLIAVILVLLAGGYWYYNHQTYGRFQQSTDNAYIAADSVIISPKIAGYVERVLVTENQTVASGDALVQLVPLRLRRERGRRGWQWRRRCRGGRGGGAADEEADCDACDEARDAVHRLRR